MKKLRRIIAMVLLLCMVVSMLPVGQLTYAAGSNDEYEYVLDTDGIDVGAEYLIVSETENDGTANVLRFNMEDIWKIYARNVEIIDRKGEKVIEYFQEEESCLWMFSSNNNGTVRNNQGYYLNMNEYSRFQTEPKTLQFANLGNGAYGIYLYGGSETNLQYLAWAKQNKEDTVKKFITQYKWQGVGTDPSSYDSKIYLYKRVEADQDVTVAYDGNAYTSGNLPASQVIEKGSTYTLKQPSNLRKDVGEDTWLFLSWNTAADGSGTEYKPGDIITVTDNITLYAQWYLQTKRVVALITNLNGNPKDIDEIYDTEYDFYIREENGTDYIRLTKKADGTYSNKVVDNGTYLVYTSTQNGEEYIPYHDHKVVIYNQDGTTECQNYSVTYQNGDPVTSSNYHVGSKVLIDDNVPSLTGNRFLGWKDESTGKVYAPGEVLTESIDRAIVLTAQWERTITVTVNVEIDHNTNDQTGFDNADNKRNVTVSLMKDGGVLVEEKDLQEGPTSQNITTYTVTYTDMPQGLYDAACTKSGYESTVTRNGNANENQTINIHLQYAPNNFDLSFNVQVECDNEAEKALMPKAVNVKVTYWGYNNNNELGWHIITQQEGEKAPTRVEINPATGIGTGSFPVWQYWSDDIHAYEYRMEVVSFVYPDGRVETAGGSYLYQPTAITIEGGRVPSHPDGSSTATDLAGAYYDGTKQVGDLWATIDITPFTVTFDAGEGKIPVDDENSVKTITLENQYQYPDLTQYKAVPTDVNKAFIGWKIGTTTAENQSGQLLTQNVIYEAVYSGNVTISGDVLVDATYQQGNETVDIHDIDQAKKVVVVLQKKAGEAYNDVASQIIDIIYTAENATHGNGVYSFANLPNDGTQYRVQVLTLNYTASYDNDADEEYDAEEAVVPMEALTTAAKVDVHLAFTPTSYEQAVKVDVSQIHENLRPTGALVRILYRDLGDTQNYNVISQHTVTPGGISVDISSAYMYGVGLEEVWNWHTAGTLYEYQMELAEIYNGETHIQYDEKSPYTVVYGPSNDYLRQETEGGRMLEAVLIPKEYPVILDLNLGDDTSTPIQGMQEFVVDDESGKERYEFIHTWSYSESFSAYPYREGYIFKGWQTSYGEQTITIEDGNIHIGAELAESITLTAQWEKLQGTDYSIRHLELNTDKVLQGATVVTGTQAGVTVMAVDKIAAIPGYVYAGAMVEGRYYDKTENPFMTITQDPTRNIMTIYYLPDGSDGYTEQVESNLEINKTAVLEDNGTYTIMLDTYTKDNPITTLIKQDTPLDIVMVLDQSGSLAANNFEYLNALQSAVDGFVESVADHGRRYEVDHRIAMVGYAGNANDGPSNDPVKFTGGKNTNTWINTGVFDSNGEFHLYNVKGFQYSRLWDPKTMTTEGDYYVKDGNEYLLLTYHREYRHLITEEQARTESLQGNAIYGYVYDEQNVGSFVELTRNSSGLWLYGDTKLYSSDKFFTYHENVWTYRNGIAPRQIYAYGVGSNFQVSGSVMDIYTRDETTSSSYDQSIYKDALVPVSMGANGSGGTNPWLLQAAHSLGANGATRSSYGMIMANEILEATPVDASEGRVRLVVMFTDGEPGYNGFNSTGDYYNQAVSEANSAIAQAYISKNTYGAYVYAIGLYKKASTVSAEATQYMHGLSSNSPQAQNMNDVAGKYTQVEDGSPLVSGKHYIRDGGTYYPIKWGSVWVSGDWNYGNYRWYYTKNSTNYEITRTQTPTVSGGKVGNYVIYQKEYEDAGYFSTTENAEQLQAYFEEVLQDITTKITQEIVLHEDTILRDIMNQGLVLTPGTVITAYTQKGTYNDKDGTILWDVDAQNNPVLEEKVKLEIPADVSSLGSDALSAKDPNSNVTINVYNLNSTNPTDPDKADYHPHTVDITGYDFHNWFISDEHREGYKMVVTITRVEAREDVEWGRSTNTNDEKSGLWLPADPSGNRELLLPFDQPTTIFVERAYVLDYGKEFTLSGWYFDDDTIQKQQATPVHVDCDIENGMNWFNPDAPNTKNSTNGTYGNTKYGNVQIANGEVTYSPTSMNWGGYDQFYVFGDTWRRPVLEQDANSNGNLWNKVTVIPANNVYYEDSFITTESNNDQNGIEGFTFTGAWTVEGNDSGNTEVPEKNESAPYGDVHGWTDSLGDDITFTDGSAHVTGSNGEIGAQSEFTFTGTGVEVYTRTNAQSGMVVAVLNQVNKNADGTTSKTQYKSIAMDNLAMSGDYYHIPTIAFKDLPYGTYNLQLIATVTSTATGTKRSEYYIDGVRVLNPLGSTTNYQADIVKDAYGLETNAVFTEVRDILLDYKDFNVDLEDSTDGKIGAVFIDWIQPGQESGSDTAGTGVPTYEIGTFEAYGPKNEVYLSAGQAVVLKVEDGNTYYVGLKSLTGKSVKANISGIDRADPTTITVEHTTDMYYQITPVDGYIVIQNANTDDAILSITNLRTTNLQKPAENGGVVPVTKQEAVLMMARFSEYMLLKEDEEDPKPENPEIPEEPPVDANLLMAKELFTSVRQWLETE